jgi:mRNA interferase RelE/StbE
VYAVRFHRSAIRDLERLDVRMRRRVGRAIDGLASDPRPDGAVKLRGTSDLWRLRVGEFRVVYQVRDDVLVVLVIRVRHRREAYR